MDSPQHIDADLEKFIIEYLKKVQLYQVDTVHNHVKVDADTRKDLYD